MAVLMPITLPLRARSQWDYNRDKTLKGYFYRHPAHFFSALASLDKSTDSGTYQAG